MNNQKTITMKKLSLLFISLLCLQFLFAEEWVNVNSEKPAPVKTTLVSSTIETTVIHFDIPGFFLDEVTTSNGLANFIKLEDATPLLQEGDPDVLKVTSSFLIPDLAQMDFEIVSSDFTEFADINMAPSKGNLTRNIDPASVPYTYSKWYKQDDYFPGKLAELREPYIIRDWRGQTLVVYPFQYNAVTKTLRVYSSLEIKIYKTGDNGVNPFIRTAKLEKVNSQFNQIYNRQFLNYYNSKYTPVDEDGSMLIICYNSFMTAMTDFVNWKKTIGLPVEIVDVATIGNSAAIKTYIANYYNTHDLAFVLLVGDAAQVPSSYSSGDSDNDYTYIVGSDHYPDIFIGRFSAENIAQVQTQVERTLDYEQSPNMALDWTKSIGIGSDQGPGDDSEYDYQHIRNLQTQLTGYGYTYHYELFDGSQGGNDASGNPTPTMVAAGINSGASVILYTGHGSDVSWGTSGFSSTNVSSLTNTGKLPFIWSVACVNGNFVGTTCFAEAWMRSTYNSEPIGAVATLMSTINQSWNPPMEGHDAMVDILVENYPNNIKRTFGGISMNGCMQMNDTYGSAGSEMTDTWTVFGDPSIVVRTKVPQTLSVSHDPTVFLGAAQFAVFANAEGAKVCLTFNNEIIGTGIINGGSTTITFPALSEIGTMKVAVTAYNYLPYIANVTITPATGPYLSYFDHVVNDNTGNNNGQIDYGENITLSVAIKNIGIAVANNVNAVLTTSDTYVTITDNTASYGNIEVNQTVSVTDGFAFVVAGDVPDNHPLLFTLEMTDAESLWSTSLSDVAYAPSLEPGTGLVINDNIGGNGNGRLDPGETATITAVVENNGHSLSPAASASLSSASPYITVNSGSASLGQIAAGNNANAVFNISCDASTPIGQSVDLAMNVDAGNYGFAHTYYQSVGLVLEDWETGDFTRFPWTFSGNGNWTMASTGQYEGFYTSKSGTITHSQVSDLSVMLLVNTAANISFFYKVSSESGYDYLHFYIDGVQQNQWSGEVAWTQASFAVTAGQHTFKWSYSKDGSVSSGSDCAWVDYIVFPPSTILAPEISVDPLVFNVTVAPDEVSSLPLLISNSGNMNLTWNASTNIDAKYKGIAAYCTASGGCDEYISNVVFNTINNASSCSQYSDYTSISTTVTAGETYNITVTNGTVYSTDDLGVWIDWNQNQDFTDAGENVVCAYSNSGQGTYAITVPQDAFSGSARMRIRIKYSGDDCGSSCGTTTYGEVEDYTVIVEGVNQWLSISPASGTISQGNNQNPVVGFDATGLSEGVYTGQITLSSNDADEGTIVIPCTMNVSPGIEVILKAMLEGPFNGSTMNPSLNAFLPLGQPYNTEPWNFAGDESVTSIPNSNIVDWVLVELRETPGDASTAWPVTTIARQAGFILNNGSIVNTDGFSPLRFNVEITNNLFAVVWHRNHLGVLSAEPLILSGGVYSHNFSSDSNAAYGSNNAHKLLAPGIWGLMSGDGYCDGEINNSDKNDVWKVNYGNSGYYSADFNMDGMVDMNDKTTFWKSNAGKCSCIVK